MGHVLWAEMLADLWRRGKVPLLIVLLDFIQRVKPHGIWDYKDQGDYENFGNWHYGLIGAALGIEWITTVSAGGIVQQITDLWNRRPGGEPIGSAGFPFLLPPYGDNPNDTPVISAGWWAYTYWAASRDQ